MDGGYLTYALLAALATALLIAAFTDLRRRQIDNWLNLAIACGAPVFWLAAGLGWTDVGLQVAVAVATFAVVAALFAIGAMGGGDVKLLTALALWIKPVWFLKLILIMAIVGGAITIVCGIAHVMRRRRDRVAVPYGIAISFAGLWVLASEYYPLVSSALQTG